MLINIIIFVLCKICLYFFFSFQCRSIIEVQMCADYTSGAMAPEDAIMTAAEYSESVYQWLQQAYQWQALAVGKLIHLTITVLLLTI